MNDKKLQIAKLEGAQNAEHTAYEIKLLAEERHRLEIITIQNIQTDLMLIRAELM